MYCSCGTALLYATNQETGKTVKNLGDIVKDNLDDAKSFVDNTVEVSSDVVINRKHLN